MLSRFSLTKLNSSVQACANLNGQPQRRNRFVARRYKCATCAAALLIAAAVSAAPVRGQLFELARLRSGMTIEDVQKDFPGYQLQPANEYRPPKTIGGVQQSFWLWHQSDLYAVVTFCNGRVIGVSRSVDADTDFPNYLSEYLGRYGQPRVSVERHATDLGDLKSINFDWSADGVEHFLTLMPEVQAGTEFRSPRAGHVNAAIRPNACFR